MNALNERNCYYFDMTKLSEIRKNNLVALISDYKEKVLHGKTHGAMTAFARHIEMNPVQLSQLQNGTAPIGNPLARQIEKKAGKPALWMDDEHHILDMSDPEQVNFVNVVMTLYRASPAHAKDAILNALSEQIERHKPSK